MQKDFWGELGKEQADYWEKGLRRYDTDSFPKRLKRLRLIGEAMKSPGGYLLYSGESGLLFEDAKNCFIFGQFAACIMVCQALLEHQLRGLYTLAGQDKIACLGFRKLLEHALTDKILPKFIADKLDELRQKRNPLVHLQDDVNRSLLFRAVNGNVTPEDLLEQEAKDAILLMFEILNRHPFAVG